MTLRHSMLDMSSLDSLTPKSTPRIKQYVASYDATKVLAHKASYSKLVAMATFLSTSGPASNT